jgi:uncharacterized protein (DUF1501 family)
MEHAKTAQHDDDHHNEHAAMSRRKFLKGATAGSVGILGASLGLPDIALGATGTKTLIKIFMRGGADGLSLFPMFGDMNYYTIRPNIKIEPPSSADPNSAIRLNNLYGMNPNLRALLPLWDQGKLAISPATHFNEGNRSHFDCQVWIEFATHNAGAYGLFNRYLQVTSGTDQLRAVRAGSTNLAGSMSGPLIVPAINDGAGYNLVNGDWCSGSSCSNNNLTKKLRELGAVDVGNAIEKQTRAVSKTMVDTIDRVQLASKDYVPSGGVTYSNSSMGRGLKVVAQLLKQNIPVEVAAIDWSGSWDTHENFIGSNITDQTSGHARGLKDGADTLMAFWTDLGPELQKNVVVMIGSEFGREAVENGSKGTDHGIGGAWMAFGGPTVGGIYRPLPDLSMTTLRERRFLPSQINYKDMMAEAMIRHLGVPQSQLSTLFPNHTFTNHSMFAGTV